jgi:hypothetical protein
MKTIIITTIFGAGVLCAAYWVGTRVGDARCRAEIVGQGVSDASQNIQQIIKVQGEINADSITTDSSLIRDWLRRQYTIAD